MKAPDWSAIRSGACDTCQGAGVYYDPVIVAGQHGEIKLCHCVDCQCNGEKPYQCWTAEAGYSWCSCRPFRLRLKETERYLKESEIPKMYQWKFFGDFHDCDPEGQPVPYARHALKAVRELLDGSAKQPGLLLSGTVGSGKTHLACIALQEMIVRQCKAARFLSISRTYFARLRDTFSEESESYGQTWQVLDQLCNMPFLLIDDFGTQRGTEWENEMIYELIDARYTEERPTIVTTNISVEDFKRRDNDRVCSRILHMCRPIAMTGSDYRKADTVAA
jgi:DNA replication protein DnaC